MMIKLGCFLDIKYFNNSFEDALEKSDSYGANALMVYLGGLKAISKAPFDKYKLELKRNFGKINTKDIIVHGPYMMNAADHNDIESNIKWLTTWCKMMNEIGLRYLVLYPGKALTSDKKIAIETLINLLNKILTQTNDVEIILEISSGNKTEILSTLEELKFVVESVNNPRLAISLDTCHLWNAGYDIKNNLENFVLKLRELDLLKLVKVIQLSDSKNDISSQNNNYENVGKGFIGLEALQSFVHLPEFQEIPMILKTPWIKIDKSYHPPYKEEINLLLKK
ncbi:MAG: deoxyribonuclease IV [Metamycoplasmataceae bacterium]